MALLLFLITAISLAVAIWLYRTTKTNRAEVSVVWSVDKSDQNEFIVKQVERPKFIASLIRRLKITPTKLAEAGAKLLPFIVAVGLVTAILRIAATLPEGFSPEVDTLIEAATIVVLISLIRLFFAYAERREQHGREHRGEFEQSIKRIEIAKWIDTINSDKSDKTEILIKAIAKDYGDAWAFRGADLSFSVLLKKYRYTGHAELPKKVYAGKSEDISVYLKRSSIVDFTKLMDFETADTPSGKAISLQVEAEHNQEHYLELELLLGDKNYISGANPQRCCLGEPTLAYRWNYDFPTDADDKKLTLIFRLISQTNTVEIGTIKETIKVKKIDHLSQRKVMLVMAVAGIIAAVSGVTTTIKTVYDLTTPSASSATSPPTTP